MHDNENSANANANAIAVFGEALVDDFITEQVVGGAPFNMARHLAAFGAASLMITRIGQDANGASVRAEFTRYGMTQAGLQVDSSAPTGRVVVERNEQGHRFIIQPDQAYDYIEPAPALAALKAANPGMLYFGTLAQRASGSRGTLQALLGASAARRFLDLNVREGQVTERCVYESLHQADIVKVNEEELQALFDWYTHDRPGTGDVASPALRTACGRLLRSFALQGLIVTLGPRGAVYFDADGGVTVSHSVQAPERLVDTVGAGDAFSAVFLYGRAQGWPLAETLARANAFAGAICGIAGAVPRDLAFYAPWIARWQAGADALAVA
ncbi:PfkB family carbohydrate kinase [Rugamonas apoptosis]|uniref:Fructokinase n=1 Tax=Rugamonas apoptosis TaxID=2758570 RepID=A0A7W2IN74_9BURK|nr:PfkB family carbohydrate kinase [Rugamonas apoptosis]MBA5690242.1 fructokinase [Rugamonas apoptosis]